MVVQVAREYSKQLTCEKFIKMFESYNSWEGLFTSSATCCSGKRNVCNCFDMVKNHTHHLSTR